jgi:peptidoglycan/LPS O-acetylase OafA/YrhL
MGLLFFYSNRALRLYPTYFLVMFLTIVASKTYLGNSGFVYHHRSDFLFDPKYWQFPEIFTPLSTFFLFGQEWTIFSGMLSIVPSSWTLGCELLFYLMVPFVVTRPFVTIILMIASICVTIYFSINGYEEEPFFVRFFPSLLVYFLSGHFGFLIYNKIKDYPLSKYIGIGGIAFFIAYLIYKVFIYEQVFLNFFGPDVRSLKAKIYFLAIALFIPFLFLVTKDSKTDRFLGNLSYSLYISHILVINVVDVFLSPYLGLKTGILSFAKIVLALNFSICIYFLIEKPLEAYRGKRVEVLISK